ncbi:hypothetical protein HELRODRAFT_169306 [Helobdella robusta]|uniref:Endonuclease/exonuclease/phosphatase domain-containing protein n=1 Tax=Helobdella robusta TaxID=6412 RepID=T1F1R6_HELRO|nr:hypothetical protein HELRODRAFT_169306 [Helobdella robusta]ESO08459.1 hypothetical protein HELRODRAFT_169306 [Helobdella robusta]
MLGKIEFLPEIRNFLEAGEELTLPEMKLPSSSLLSKSSSKIDLLNSFLKSAVNDYARFKGYPRDIIVIVAYAPTTDHSDDEVEMFYKQLEQTLKALPKKDVKIIVGDWNAKTGSDNIGFQEVMGKYGVGGRNDRGERSTVSILLQSQQYISLENYRSSLATIYNVALLKAD